MDQQLLALEEFMTKNNNVTGGNSPKSGKLAIGIDLGTTISCAAVYRNGNSEVVPNKAGRRLTPSQIYYFPHTLEVCCGEAAYDAAPNKLQNFLCDVKRIIGRNIDDIHVQELIDSHNLPYKIVSGENKKTAVELLHDDVMVQITPEQACSEILKDLRESACEQLGNITEAVISVPAKFSGAQRKATRDAAQLAGFTEVNLITEPVAAAIHYTNNYLDGETNGKLLVFDFGGGTLDVSIIEVNGHRFEVVCVEGDTFLGGRDIDKKILDYFLPHITDQFGYRVISDRVMRRLRKNCEKLKRYLTDNIEYSIWFDCIAGNEENSYLLTLTRRKLEDLCKDLFDKAMCLIQKCLKEAGLLKTDIKTVVLVGGTTRIPKIREMITLFFEEIPVNIDTNPDEAVALGAAIQAALLKGENKELEIYRITEVTPVSLGILTGRGYMSTLIKRNSKLPTSKTKTFCTSGNDQKLIEFKIFEGERKNCSFNNLLGKFSINNLPLGKADSVSIKVTYSLNKDGILEVSAVEKTTGVNNKLTVTLEHLHLCQNQVTNMLEDAENNKLDDDIFERFVLYEIEVKRFVNHIMYELDKICDIAKRSFVSKKCETFIVAVDALLHTEINILKEKFDSFRKDVEPQIKNQISFKEYLPKNSEFCLETLSRSLTLNKFSGHTDSEDTDTD